MRPLRQFYISSSVCRCFDNGNSWKKIQTIARKEVMRLGSLPSFPPPALTTTSLFSLLPLNPYSLQCKQRLCHLHTCPVPGTARRERVHSQSSCTIQGLLPVLILSTECNFTTTVYSACKTFLSVAFCTGIPRNKMLAKNLVLTCHAACCSPSGHDPTWGNTWLQWKSRQ